MSYICQYKDPASGSWEEKEFDDEQDAYIFARNHIYAYVYHS